MASSYKSLLCHIGLIGIICQLCHFTVDSSSETCHTYNINKSINTTIADFFCASCINYFCTPIKLPCLCTYCMHAYHFHWYIHNALSAGYSTVYTRPMGSYRLQSWCMYLVQCFVHFYCTSPGVLAGIIFCGCQWSVIYKMHCCIYNNVQLSTYYMSCNMYA